MPVAFPESYSEARSQFRALNHSLRAQWPTAHLEVYALNGQPDLTVDWFDAMPLDTPRRLLVVTTGLHGIEGYVGDAVLHLLVEELLPRFDPRTTGLLLIHALNPWGMAHRQKTNAANVDLNRNFMLSGDYPADFNPDYDVARAAFDPQRPVRRCDLGLLPLLLALVAPLRRLSIPRLQEAFLIGQYRHADGIFYGGRALQGELQLLLGLLRPRLAQVDHAVYLEMHTGYGPRDQMSLVHSPREARSPRDLSVQFDYPLVVCTEPGAFYAIHGDVVDGLYSLARSEFPRTRFYGVTCEFGTLGDSGLNQLRSMQTMVLANQLRHHGAVQPGVAAEVRRRFEALYVPDAVDWREKALADARRALEGILRTEGFL